MKKFIVQNIINLILGILIAFLYFYMKFKYAAILGVLWLGYLIWSNYSLLSRNSVSTLADLDKEHLFKDEILILALAGNSIEIKRDLFMEYKEGDSYRQAFELIEAKFNSIVASSEKFLLHYDYIRRPDASYFKGLVNEVTHLIKQLDDLSNLVIQVDNTANNIDSTFVDDIIQSLRSVNENE